MIEERVLEKYPVDAVFGMHNWPGLPVGQFAIQPGPMMAAFDIFEIEIKGRGAHAAMPHLAVDPIAAAAQVVNGLQTIVSRNTHPLEGAVVSVTQIHGGDTWTLFLKPWCCAEQPVRSAPQCAIKSSRQSSASQRVPAAPPGQKCDCGMNVDIRRR